ncbi:hypothetical protein E5222_01110 [Alteraurantiacibacter aquimixticola]|uniref:Flippase-like domain-containing protein n=1 Tax=Alteraurantiacibacter aquimixticola TaxID=2489173 RepID=A0A4T3F480_9SPHN|nr:hypothetical protein E5222_01110 [Alteraurantiacibacter aquimixticola]
MPQDRPRTFSWTRALTILLSLLVVAAALSQISTLDAASILDLVPSSPSFWVLFALGFMAGPLSEWYIFNRLWGVGRPALGALTRKLVYNELLLGYLGEAWFYAWARKNSQVEAAPFGAVKDVAVLSAMAGNVMTLVLIALAIPFLDLLPLGEHGAQIGWSLAFVVASSLAVMVWRKALFSLPASELRMVFAVHVARILATTLISAMLWNMVLPETPIGWWLVLAAIRLLISRLPFVPNKDVVFAGVAVLAAGAHLEIAGLVAMMAGLILAANLIVGLGFSLIDLLTGERSDAPAR